VRKESQNDEVLQFVRFWKERTGKLPRELIFDSKLTTYANLARLNEQGIEFITLRRRSHSMLQEIWAQPASAWRQGPDQGDQLGFHAAHGEAGHGAMGLIGERAEVGIDVRNELLDENGFEGTNIETPETAEPDVVRHAVDHHDDEGPDLPFGNQVVHDQSGAALGTLR